MAHVGHCGIIYSPSHLAGRAAAVLGGIEGKQAVLFLSSSWLPPLDVSPPQPASSSGLTVDQTPVSCCFSVIYTQLV